MTATASQIETEVQAPAKAQTAGGWLRAARQAQGLHIAALAAQLKVPQAKLEALEADRHQDLPDATFARALAKAMCRVLKVDAAPVLALLPRGTDPELDRVSKGLNEPFRDRSAGLGAPSLAWLKKPAALAPLGLLLAALLVYLLPADLLTPRSTVAESALPLAQAPVVIDPAGAASQPAPAGTELAAAPAGVPAEAEPASAPTAAAQAAPPAATPVAVPAGGQVPLRLAARSESWVEVSDARGQVLYSKLMRPGESAELQVAMPVRLRVGNAAGTELSLRGAPVDLLAQARDNVVRMELN